MSILSVEQQKKTLSKAIELEKSGDAQAAANILEQLVKDAPKSPEVRFQLARMLLSSKAPVLALPHLALARKYAPEVLATWKLSARAILAFGETKDINAYKKDLRNAPLSVKDKQFLFAAITHVSHGGFGGAPKEEADAAIKALSQGDFETARDLAAAMDKKYPGSGHTLNLLATAYEGLADQNAADLLFSRAVLLEPRAPSILINYCRFLCTMTRWVDALRFGEKSLELKPDEPRAKIHLAQIYQKLDQPQKAIDLANEAMAQGVQTKGLIVSKAVATADVDGVEAGIAVLNDYIERTKDEAAKLERGNLFQQSGQFERARSDYLDVIAAAPTQGEGYFQVSISHKFTLDDPLLTEFEAASNNPDLGTAAKSAINFALAKAYEDTKQFDKVFHPLNIANGIIRDEGRWNSDSYAAGLERMRKVAKEADLRETQSESDNTYNPIFVSGLPRSGTTLTEQILSRHSTLTGVGEALWSPRFFQPISLQNEEGSTARSRILDAGRSYQAAASDIHGANTRIVDKALMNHERLGLIAAAMPKAKIIILMRDPRDNLLSIYKNRFGQNSLTFNSDMRALAFAYAQKLKMLEYWENVLPGSFYKLDYGKLTENPETETRKILAYCELDWEDGVMDSGPSENSIKTLSSFQARQPIYKSSVRSWEKYADDLKPMIDALKEFGVPLED